MEKLGKTLAWVIGTLLVIGGVLRLTLFETWKVPHNPYLAASLAPTLRAGDTVLLLTRGVPGQGDLVRCPDPEKPNSFVVGRIVGLPGDHVFIQGFTPVINGQRYTANDACQESRFVVKDPDTQTEMEMTCSRVEMGGDWHYQGTSKRPMTLADYKKNVGTGRVFLLSDNRVMHDDSRDFGLVDQASCNRRIVFRLWSAKGWLDSKSRMTMIH